MLLRESFELALILVHLLLGILFGLKSKSTLNLSIFGKFSYMLDFQRELGWNFFELSKVFLQEFYFCTKNGWKG